MANSNHAEQAGAARAKFCQERGVALAQTSAEAMLGFAVSTDGLLPVNGLRHAPLRNTSGWYIWCGEELSQAPDFFVPMHAGHLYEQHPELVRLLGLPTGYRFLLAGDYLDVWFDEALLEVQSSPISGGNS